MVIFLIVGVVLLGMGVALVYGSTSARAAGRAPDTLAQIEAYGFAAEPIGQPGVSAPAHRPLRGLAQRIGGFVQGGLGVGERGVRRDLLAAGMYTTDPLTIVGYRVLAALAGVGVWLWLAISSDISAAITILGLVFFGVLGWMLPVLVIRRRGRKRTERIEYELPELIDVLVVTLEAGLSFLASMHMAAQRMEGPLGVELRLMLQEQRMGLGMNEALEGMLRRCDTPSLRTFVRSILQGETLGVSIGQIMRNLAVEMRKRRRAAAEERAQKAPIKMLFPLIFLIFPAMFVIILGPAFYAVGKIFNH